MTQLATVFRGRTLEERQDKLGSATSISPLRLKVGDEDSLTTPATIGHRYYTSGSSAQALVAVTISTGIEKASLPSDETNGWSTRSDPFTSCSN